MKAPDLFAALLLSSSLFMLSACGGSNESPPPPAATNTPTATHTRPPTQVPSSTSTRTPTTTRTNTPTATHTQTPTATPTATATSTLTPTSIVSPAVPDNLKVPVGNTVFLEGHADGTQNYICLPCPNTITTAATCPASGFAWAFFGPQATLLNDQDEQIITHFLSPNPGESGTPRATWQNSKDTSHVWAKAMATSSDSAFVAPGAIPWLLLQVVGAQSGPTNGNTLTATTFIHRVNTSAGVAPATGCVVSTDVGSKALVHYTANYFFYKAETDSLYIGDETDLTVSIPSTVKRFDAKTGAFLGAFVADNSGGLQGPRGSIFEDPGQLLVVNQNANLEGVNGTVLRYNGKTGAFWEAIVPATDPTALLQPRGMVLWDHKVLFVADLGLVPPDNAPGRLLEFSKDGTFVADRTPDAPDFPREQFFPRGLVIGPDGLLYLANATNLVNTPLGGDILRFDPATGHFVDRFITSSGGGACNCVNELNRPEGLVFGPDGNIYIASFRADATDNDKILILQGPAGAHPGAYVGRIDLDVAGQDREFAEALLFGPEGRLFVPITGRLGPDAGAVRRYNVSTKEFDVFVPPSAQGGPLGAPWYLTFGKTDPATLAYGE